VRVVRAGAEVPVEVQMRAGRECSYPKKYLGRKQG
jgi:hypothetical protein